MVEADMNKQLLIALIFVLAFSGCSFLTRPYPLAADGSIEIICLQTKYTVHPSDNAVRTVECVPGDFAKKNPERSNLYIVFARDRLSARIQYTIGGGGHPYSDRDWIHYQLQVHSSPEKMPAFRCVSIIPENGELVFKPANPIPIMSGYGGFITIDNLLGPFKATCTIGNTLIEMETPVAQ